MSDWHLLEKSDRPKELVVVWGKNSGFDLAFFRYNKLTNLMGEEVHATHYLTIPEPPK